MSVFLGAIKKGINDLTSNQYYKGLNNRYDKRITKLKKLRFKLDRDSMQWHIGQFREFEVKLGRYMSNEFVMVADNRSFNDKLNRML